MGIRDGYRPHSLIDVLASELSQWSGWQPRADIYRCRDHLLVKLELAGVAERDLKISLQQDALVVEGRRRDWCVAETAESLSMEISYDYFRRAVRLPASVATGDIQTEYRDGMLLIHLPLRSGASR